MKLKLMIFNGILVIGLLSGCSEGEELLSKLNQLINQESNSEETSAENNNGEEATDQNNNDEIESNTNSEDQVDKVNQDDDANGEDNSSEAMSDSGPNVYKSVQGDQIELPLGNKSFATDVIEYIVGDPAPMEKYADPLKALGEPDYDEATDEGYVSLGGEYITLKFGNARLVDGPGDDLYVFEIGPHMESQSIDVEVSTDGEQWLHVGHVIGGVDIGQYIVSPDDEFKFVRIQDLRDYSGMKAEIDAVAIINGVLE